MRRRIVTFAILIVALALVILAVPFGSDIRSRIRADERSKLARLAAVTAADISVEASAGTDRIELAATPGSSTRIAVYSAGGQRLAGSGPLHLDTALGAILPGSVKEGSNAAELIVAVPISVEEKLIAVVRASEDSETLTTRIRAAWTRIALASLAALLVATGLAVALSNRLLRPLQQLKQAAESIGTGVTVPVIPSGLPEFDAIARALTLSHRRVEDSMSRERAFSADVSHQLRTPITGLRLTLDNELEHPRADPQKALHEALRDVDHLESTVEGLLALARDTMDRRSLIDLDHTITARTLPWRTKLVANGRELMTRGLSTALPVRASAQAVGEILDVLLSNASTHARGVVTVEVERRPVVISVRVSDAGPGLDDPLAVFQRRDSDSRGTGIGLALALRLAEAEGGTLTLVHHQGFCTFELLLPV